ncbi:hypothetical protein IMZ11_07255 [Microtetraspora sp. AC03309]|uniref:hypothetical protein n=1 Tax=Microtetraspora sp. AC03309 TaxID=2779376 RepID=UPI001E5B03E7|nr:hypothetical protein [Microtetraspora sp. AC03309]MCC5575437.1 hypothetical protein [Microtetraspora sp. AC03309]
MILAVLTPSILVGLPNPSAADPVSAADSNGVSAAIKASVPEGGTPVVDEALEAAKAEAAKTGKRVPVPSQYTENMKVWANTDGKTLHAELSTGPVQLQVAGKNGKKTWKPIDTTIVKQSDGTFAPKRVKTPLTFGGEGSIHLVTAKGEDGKAGFSWARKLPAPKISGNTITYQDAVSTGTDLVITALADGFTQDVVLRKRPTGPLKVELPVTLPKGMSYAKASDGSPQLMSAYGGAARAPIALQALDALARLREGRRRRR